MLYGVSCSGVDIRTIRLAIARIIDARHWTQDTVAARCSVSQSHVSKIIRVGDDPAELKDLAARVLFDIIENGLGLTLSEFFAQIERQTETDLPAELGRDKTPRIPSPNKGRAHVGTPIPAAERDAIVDELLIELGTRIATAARTPGRPERPDRAVPRPRQQKPDRRRRGA